MTERKYSVSEIDRMRSAVEMKFYDRHQGQAYYPADMTKWVEEVLRTYLIAGVDPQELGG